MHYLLILYYSTYGIYSIPVLHEFDSKPECERVLKHLSESHGFSHGGECYPMDMTHKTSTDY